MTKSVRLQWISSLPTCARVHDAMITATILKHETSMKHICQSKKFEDLCKILVRFYQHEPFNMKETRLHYL